jgi:nitrate reductase gamma subunit
MHEFTFSDTADWVVGVLLFSVTIAGLVATVFA